MSNIAVWLGIIAIVAGILILAFPFLLNIIVAVALLVGGAIALYQGVQRGAAA
jgi:uncharacterized membrane protein HdeD (DUF308 family)